MLYELRMANLTLFKHDETLNTASTVGFKG